MSFIKSVIKRVAILSLVLAIVSNIYIFTYPSLNPINCSWKSATNEHEPVCKDDDSLSNKVIFTVKSYIADLYDTTFNYKNKQSQEEAKDGKVPDLHILTFGDPQINGIWKDTPYASRLDIFGNDYYLGHIYKSMVQRLNPSHLIVMGDLFSSQWLPDFEFYNRAKRYVSRIFHNAIPSSKERIASIKENQQDENGDYKSDWQSTADHVNSQLQKPETFEFGYSDVWKWNNDDPFMFINMTGNHDIGYSGDMTWQHLARWNDFFGKDNFYIEYDVQTEHPWRIINLNSMVLDSPGLQNELQETTWEFLYQIFERNFNGSTILLTHIPFAKKKGLCQDGPNFNYYPKEYPNEPYKSELLRSQNHLTQETTDKVLNLVFHNKRNGIILTGHDHEGCETVYNMYQTEIKKQGYSDAYWTANRNADPRAVQHVKEITVRSMMGDFHGATGLVNGHFNGDDWVWSFTLCKFSIQHVWWFTKVTTILATLFTSLWILL